MRRRHYYRQPDQDVFAEINIVPLTDMALVLLIIFMITATFITTSSGLDIRLPEAASALSQDQMQAVVFITRDGSLYLNAETIDVPGLSVRLAAAVAADPQMMVVVSADRAVQYAAVVEVLDAVRNSGAKNLALAVELPEESSP